MNKKMVITAVCLLAMSAMMAQNITGKVVDTKGEPLPFANVMLLNRADSALRYHLWVILLYFRIALAEI